MASKTNSRGSFPGTNAGAARHRGAPSSKGRERSAQQAGFGTTPRSKAKTTQQNPKRVSATRMAATFPTVSKTNPMPGVRGSGNFGGGRAPAARGRHIGAQQAAFGATPRKRTP